MVRLETPNRTAADDQTFNRPGGRMATDGKDETVSLQELLVTSLAQTDALAKLLIEKGVITQDEFLEKLKAERATYQAMIRKIS